MKIGKSPEGFTIVETLIVLGITGLLFYLTFANFKTVQNNTTFKTAVFDMQTTLQSIIANAANGVYHGGNVACSQATGTTLITPKISSTTNSQGTNRNCDFIGVGLYFRRYVGITYEPLAVYEATGTTPVNNLSAYSVAPLLPTDPAFQSYESQDPNILLSNDQTVGDHSSTYYSEGHLMFSYVGAYARPIDNRTCQWLIAIAFSNSNGALGMAPYLVDSPTTLTGCNNSGNLPSDSSDPDFIANYFYGAKLIPAITIQECFNSTTTNQSANFVINSNSTTNGLGISTNLFSKPDCAP